ncbi:MAG: PilZ domain-containing protein [Planctomycetota bacterium]|jgi:hypothetical protein
MAESGSIEHRRAPRHPLEPDECDLSFVVEEDSLEVVEANISETGLGFTTSQPLKVKLALRYGEELEDREATLVWVRRNDDGSMNYGFEFNKA